MAKTVKALVIGGGGGGGSSNTSGGGAGGGGAGGYIYYPTLEVFTGSFPIVVGQGGIGSPDEDYYTGYSGGNSSAFGYIAVGGGGGGSRDPDTRGVRSGLSGGSGGGASYVSGAVGGAGTPGQGYAGANRTVDEGGGGGGAGSAGNPSGDGSPGQGVTNSITGVSLTYAQGGSGGSPSTTVLERGYGGNGGRYNTNPGTSTGQTGGNGIVVIRYATADYATCTGGTITTDGTDTIHTFSTSGTFTLTFATTQAVTDIAYDTATANGTTISGGGPIITERGFVWNTSTAPTVGNNKLVVAGTTGTFSGSMTGLTPATLYYVRSYVKDANNIISYGEEVTFTSLAVPANTIAKDIDGVEGQTYAVRMYIGDSQTSPTYVTAGASVGSDTDWTNPGNITANDGSYANVLGTAVSSSDKLVGNGLGFNVPLTATITGIEVEIKGSANATGTPASQVVGLTKDGTASVGTTKTGTQGTIQSVVAYGGTADLWGTTWTPSEINASTFGGYFVIGKLSQPGSTYGADIDYIKVNVYFTTPTNTVTVKLGSTGTSETFNAGDGYVTMQGTYSGVNGLLIESSDDFGGYIDNVSHVLVLGTAVIDWDLDTLTNVFPINSSVLFRRLEDEDFNRFRIYRYLDIQFKDLDAYVTVLLKKEASEGLTTSTKEFLVSNESVSTLPFINKRISMLVKNQAILIGLSNNRLSETFTVCQLIVKGIEPPEKMFDASKIINVL